MADMMELTIRQIIAKCGGAAAVASTLQTSQWTVYKWYQIGIPVEYWEAVMDLSGLDLPEIYKADRLAKAKRVASQAAA